MFSSAAFTVSTPALFGINIIQTVASFDYSPLFLLDVCLRRSLIALSIATACVYNCTNAASAARVYYIVGFSLSAAADCPLVPRRRPL